MTGRVTRRVEGPVAAWLRWAGIALLCSACSKQPAPPEPAAASQPAAQGVACAVEEGQPNPAARQAAKVLQDQVQLGPLYRAAAARSPLTACAWRFLDGQALAQAYRFRNGDQLQVQRDASIEYSNQSLSLAEPLPDPAADPPVNVLKQAESASFGPAGCGIDWQAAPEAAPPSAQAEAGTVSEAVYRGNACNCQARVRKNAAGRAVGLMLRSAC